MRSYECETGVCKLLRGLQRGASGLVNDGGGAGHIDEGHPSPCSPIGDSYTLTVKGGRVRTFFPFIIAETHTHTFDDVQEPNCCINTRAAVKETRPPITQAMSSG